MAEGKVMLKYQGVKAQANHGLRKARLSEKARLGFRLVAERQRCSKKKEMLCCSE